jgi:hypothetical protein
MKILLDDATEVAKGVWLTLTPPHQVTKMGQPRTTQGTRTVLLASSPAFDAGTTGTTVVIDTVAAEEVPADSGGERAQVPHELGPGDREFLSMAERELRGEVQEVAVDLLREVRRRSAGDMKRGLKNNFSNTPDNFWYVIVQPREQALSITVRGKPEMFRPSPLELRVDRPGYTRFKLQSVDQLPEALRIVFWHLDRR